MYVRLTYTHLSYTISLLINFLDIQIVSCAALLLTDAVLVTKFYSGWIFSNWRPFTCINSFPHNDTFWRQWETSLLKTLWEKEKLLVTSNFSFSHNVFYHFWRTFCHFRQIWNCRLQTLSVWKSLKLSSGNGSMGNSDSKICILKNRNRSKW